MKKYLTKDLLLAGIGSRVRTLRQAHNWTVQELAARAGLSQRFIIQLEAGSANISIAKLAQVTGALDGFLPALIAPAEHDNSIRAQVWRLLLQGNDEDWRAAHDWLQQRQGKNSTKDHFIALIGLRGVGKSTLGPMLAKRLKTNFVEVDRVVEEAAGLSLAEIFTTHGEPYFKKLEAAALQKLLAASTGCVFAPGGSVVNDTASWNLIKQRCTTVWLHATPKELLQRMIKARETRLISSPTVMADMKSLLAQREPLYAESEISIKTTGQTPAAVAAAILQALAKKPKI